MLKPPNSQMAQPAAARLAALQRHLTAEVVPNVSLLSLNETSAPQDGLGARPAPGGGPGTLSIIDNRTGKKYDVEISEHGTVKATDFKKIVAGGDGVGLKLFDPG